jgi:site-specific recombinase XerD
MEVEEIEAILAQPDRTSPEGQRDHTLLALLYNTGARIQEVLNLCPQEIRFEPPARVRIMGKACHSYCISFRRRHRTTGTRACCR